MNPTQLLTCGAACGALSLAPFAHGGVVYEIETTDHGASEPRVESTEMAVEGKNLKMTISPGDTGRKGDMIYNGGKGRVVVTDASDKSYYVMDKAFAAQVSKQLEAAKKLAQNVRIPDEALKNLTPEQRKALEKALGGRAPQAVPKAKPKSVKQKTGEKATKGGYPCVKYVYSQGGKKVREIWVTDWDNIEGDGKTIQEMREFMNKVFGDLGGGLGGKGKKPGEGGPFGDSWEIFDDGFPVEGKSFEEDGSLEDHWKLRSARRRTLDPADFEPPAGYKRRHMFGP